MKVTIILALLLRKSHEIISPTVKQTEIKFVGARRSWCSYKPFVGYVREQPAATALLI